MHKLEILDPNIDLNSLEYFMADHSDFIMTQNSFRNDLGTCVICLHEPYIVCHIQKFRLNKEESVKEFYDWQFQRIQAEEYKREADKLGLSVKEYIETVLHMTYDKEFDEPRLIAKVPGLNVFLELYGFIFGVSNLPKYQNQSLEINEPLLFQDIIKDMQDAAVWFRTQKKMHEIRNYGTTSEDKQLLNSWVEKLDDQEFFKRSPRRGIGFENIDLTRRDPLIPRHKFNDEELAEYIKLKSECFPEKSLAEIMKMAVDNVRNRKNE